MCLVYKGIQPHCFQVLQLDRNFERRQYGVLQPIAFSLATALEQQQQPFERKKQVDEVIHANDIATLTRLLNSLEMDFGTRFFRPTDPSHSPSGMQYREHGRRSIKPTISSGRHVRYVRPPHGWNEAGDNLQGNQWLDLIAGFTSGGVLCGVYLTDVRIPRSWITAPGAYPFDGSAIDLTRLRIAY
ncbi:unnamed protein product [Peronospora belbahrii]|uniref:Uncharacterized protein n=1 Tax=Peronospora belbahrii TaxID=622444 RepID=A0ABN8CRJ3_9STRA|nr:unnamed protein product [Peronospora belbahrii]